MEKNYTNGLDKTFEIVEYLLSENAQQTLRSIAQEVGMSKSAVFRQVTALAEIGCLVQDPVTKTYQIGPRLLALSSTIISQHSLRKIAHPIMEKLAVQVGETVNLCMLSRFNIFDLDRVEPPTAYITYHGGYAPAHATSVGKILLSAQSTNFIDQYCTQLDTMPPLTENTIQTANELREALIQVRVHGYAVDHGEVAVGMNCIAAPIRNMNGEICAAISISGAAARMESRESELIAVVQNAAKHISAMQGYHA